MAAPVPNEMDANAMMFPDMLEVLPRVAELPTCQKTLAGDAWFISLTMLPVAVVRPLPI
jgi:hypothetical protein